MIDSQKFNPLERNSIATVVALLERHGVKFHIEGDGIELGEPIAREQKRFVKHKGILEFAIEQMAGMVVGDSIQMDLGEFPPEALQPAASNAARKLWGASTVKTTVVDGQLYVLRKEVGHE